MRGLLPGRRYAGRRLRKGCVDPVRCNSGRRSEREPNRCRAFSGDGKTFAAIGAGGSSIQVWDSTRARNASALRRESAFPTASVISVARRRQGTSCRVYSEGVKLWDVPTGSPSRSSLFSYCVAISRTAECWPQESWRREDLERGRRARAGQLARIPAHGPRRCLFSGRQTLASASTPPHGAVVGRGDGQRKGYSRAPGGSQQRGLHGRRYDTHLGRPRAAVPFMERRYRNNSTLWVGCHDPGVLPGNHARRQTVAVAERVQSGRPSSGRWLTAESAEPEADGNLHAYRPFAGRQDPHRRRVRGPSAWTFPGETPARRLEGTHEGSGLCPGRHRLAAVCERPEEDNRPTNSACGALRPGSPSAGLRRRRGSRLPVQPGDFTRRAHRVRAVGHNGSLVGGDHGQATPRPWGAWTGADSLPCRLLPTARPGRRRRGLSRPVVGWDVDTQVARECTPNEHGTDDSLAPWRPATAVLTAPRRQDHSLASPRKKENVWQLPGPVNQLAPHRGRPLPVHGQQQRHRLRPPAPPPAAGRENDSPPTDGRSDAVKAAGRCRHQVKFRPPGTEQHCPQPPANPARTSEP
jgi:hypothetical protein